MIANEGKDNFLILVYGLPASGKTTFSQSLQKKYFDNEIVLISADLIESQLQRNKKFIVEILQQTNMNNIIKKLSELITDQKQNKKAQFDSQNWKNSRLLVQKIIQKLIPTNSIILEDDLLLRSQRRVYQKLSWKLEIKYLQIYMESTLVECLQNLKKRNQMIKDQVITEDVIQKASAKLQINDSQYTLKLPLKDREKITKQTILNKLKKVIIKPNDPNDPQFYKQKPKYQHTNQQSIELQTRRFINSLMKLTQIQLSTRLNQKISKNNLGKILSEWKKIYLKYEERTKNIQQIQKHLLNYIHQI